MTAAVSVLVLALVLVVEAAPPQCISDKKQEFPDLSHITPFSLDLLKQFNPKGTTSNLFFSPYSIWNALVLAYFGSAGNTQKELGVALRLYNTSHTLATYKTLKDLTSERRKYSSQYVIDLANKLYVDDDVTLSKWASQVLPDELHTLNFSQPLEVAKTINQFVNQTTRGKIDKMVEPEDVLGAPAVLVNAAYFKGSWASRFNPNNTRMEIFKSTSNSSKKVEMMTQSAYLEYGVSPELRAKVLKLPYVCDEVSMLVLLPSVISDKNCSTTNTTPIDCLVQRLNADLLHSALSHLEKTEIRITLPKFKLKQTLTQELREALAELKIRDLFTTAANLTKYDPTGQLSLGDKTVHKAVVEVNEEGTEAAAATTLVSRTITKFFCGRPFLFFIYDNLTNNILFAGIYRQP